MRQCVSDPHTLANYRSCLDARFVADHRVSYRSRHAPPRSRRSRSSPLRRSPPSRESIRIQSWDAATSPLAQTTASAGLPQSPRSKYSLRSPRPSPSSEPPRPRELLSASTAEASSSANTSSSARALAGEFTPVRASPALALHQLPAELFNQFANRHRSPIRHSSLYVATTIFKANSLSRALPEIMTLIKVGSNPLPEKRK